MHHSDAEAGAFPILKKKYDISADYTDKYLRIDKDTTIKWTRTIFPLR
jgi:hypothetical protein